MGFIWSCILWPLILTSFMPPKPVPHEWYSQVLPAWAGVLLHLDQWNQILGVDLEENTTPGGCFWRRTTSEVVQAFFFHINLPFNKWEPLIGGAFPLRHHFCFPSAGHRLSLQRHWTPSQLQLPCYLHSPSKCLFNLAYTSFFSKQVISLSLNSVSLRFSGDWRMTPGSWSKHYANVFF